jgi:predicted N-formylglutamate amidohydrolase
MTERLLAGEDDAALVLNAGGNSPIMLICEHASRRIPKSLGTLGLPESELARHIAWDIGAEAVARMLAKFINAPLALQRYSRLVYDCNRPPESENAIPLISETTRILGNENLPTEQKLERIASIYRPFHAAVSQLIDQRTARGLSTTVVSIHSFTPVYKGRERRLDIGILYDRDTRLADRLVHEFHKFDVRRNEPYGPKDGVLHTLHMHAEIRGLPYAMIEIRNDLITDERGQSQWAHRLSVALQHALGGEVR